MNENRFFRYWIELPLFPKIIFVCLILSCSQLYSQPLADGHSKFLGNVLGSSIPASFDSYWNQVTPENSGKWGSVAAPGQDASTWNWGGLDMAYDYALSRDFIYKHHTLVWGQQQPWWLQYLDSLEQAQKVEEWIQLVGERYPDMSLVDVVNEPLPDHAPPSYKNALGGNGSTGWDWVIWCFEKARQYCSDSTKLILNEYNLLNSNYNTDQIIGIVNLLKDRGLIDGIGVQCHRGETQNVAATTLQYNLNKLAATGIPIYISEFDIGPDNNSQPNESFQLTEYQRVFPILWEHPGVKGITFWGYLQNAPMWQKNCYLIRSDGSETPAMQWLREYLSGTEVKEFTESIPADYTLYQNYPNPFNPTTTIEYSIASESFVELKIYDVLGREIKTLVNKKMPAGRHTVDFEANNLDSGIYLYQIKAGDFSQSKKMILVR